MTMTRVMTTLALLLAITGGAAACGGRTADPARAVEAFIAAARNGDSAEVYQHLGPRTRERLAGILRSAERLSGRLALQPADFLAVGRAPAAWEVTSIRTIKREEHEAWVEVFSETGDRHDLRLSRSKDSREWKIELPGS